MNVLKQPSSYGVSGRGGGSDYTTERYLFYPYVSFIKLTEIIKFNQHLTIRKVSYGVNFHGYRFCFNRVFHFWHDKKETKLVRHGEGVP